MTRLLRLCASLALVLVGCSPFIPPDPVEPPHAEEACDAFCDLYVRLQCEDSGDSPGPDEIEGTADDVPCSRVCRDELVAGEYVPDRECLNTAQSCEAAEACMFGPADGPEMGQRGLQAPLRGPHGSGPWVWACGPSPGPESPSGGAG